MRSRMGQTSPTIPIILWASTYFVALFCAGTLAAMASPGNKANDGEKRFADFKQRLEKRIHERIATIESWMPVEEGDPLKAVVIAVRGPMRQRLEETMTQFMTGLDEKAKKSEIQKALKDEASIDTQVNKYFKAVNTKLLEEFDESKANLAALLSPQPLSRWMIIAIGSFFLIAFIFLIVIIYYMIREAYQKEEEPPQPARLVKGTVRSVIAVAITYLIFLLALTNFLLNQRIGGYLTAAFASVIVFYFGSRAIDAFYARKGGFCYSKTLPDGTKEKIEGYEAPEAAQRVAELTRSLQTTINEIGKSVRELQRSEEEGLGFVGGTVAFSPDKGDKSGVSITVRDLPGISTTTAVNGSYLLRAVPPGDYTLRAEQEGYLPGTKRVQLKPRQYVKVPQMLMKEVPPPAEGQG